MFTGDAQIDRESRWAPRVLHDCAPPSAGDARLADLIAGRAGVLVLRGLLSEPVLSSALAAIATMEPLVRDNSYPNTRLITIGPYLAGALESPQRYFDAAKQLADALPPGLAGFSASIYGIVASALGLDLLDVALEGTTPYSPFMVLIHRNGMAMPPHNDMIARDARGSDLHIAGVSSQLRCTICLQECSSGGELILYRKPWSSGDERHKVLGNFGYPLDLVAGCETLTFKPMTGDIYIFNTTYYHEVAEISGNTRVTMGFFFGHNGASDRAMVAWS